MAPDILRQINALAVLGIVGLLAFAFLDQFLLSDLPCPLCILQRVGFLLAGFGFALNVVFGCRPAHYGIAILGALAGAAVSARQVMLHIAPGTGSYGEPLFGLHFYTWAFIAFVAIIAGAAVLLLVERQFARTEPSAPHNGRGPTPTFGKVAVGLFGLMALANALSTFAECGLGLCPDDPTRYELLEGEPDGAADQ